MITAPRTPDAPAVPQPVDAPRRTRWWRLLILLGAAGLAVVVLHDRMPSPAATAAALRQAGLLWLLAAAVMQAVSLVAFAEQERRLLGGFGVSMPPGAAVVITVARSAMAIALPGGSAIAAAYGFRQFRLRGATRPVAAAVTLLCGVASITGLALLYAGDALLRTGPIVAGTVAAGLVVLIVVLRRIPWRLPPPGPAVPATALRRLWRTVRETATLASMISRRRWLLVLSLAGLNWLSQLLCLLACVRALHLSVPVPIVAAAFLGAQLARQIPGTAGGIGVIEAGLTLALSTTGGAPVAVAAAAVIAYRLLSCWILLPIGAVCWTALRPARASDSRPASLSPVALAGARRGRVRTSKSSPENHRSSVRDRSQ